MKIRAAALSDSAAISALTGELGYVAEAGAIAERLARLARRSDTLVLVAETEEVVVGWIQAQTFDTLESGFRAYIVGLIVSERARRQGIGRALVGAAEAWARQAGADAVVVRSNTKRIESHRFYPALGFTESKTQSVYRKNLR